MYGGYSSEFDDGGESTGSKKRPRSYDTEHKTKHPFSGHSSKIPKRSSYVDAYEKEEKKAHFAQFLSMNAYARHQKLVHDYINYYGGSMKDFQRDTTKDKTDHDVLIEHHKFVWDDEDADTWGKKLAKRYYDKLFKEYCISDLSRYKENKFAMRWRIEKEVVEGKGQFVCGARKCECRDGLKTWEVNFGYMEHGEKKNTLVKLRLCPDCSYKLNYNHKHKRLKKKKKMSVKKNKKHKKHKKHKKRKHRESSTEESSSAEEEVGGDESVAEKNVTDSSAASNNSEDVNDVWKKPISEQVEKSKEDELDDYLEDLFM